jgi:HD-like signal output (HDOD) protein
MMTRDLILEKVKAFPPLDDTVSKVMAICNDENGSVGELAKVVQSDPMTMANILKAANSPLYGFSREIKSISQAVSIFGMDTVKGFAFSSFLQKKLNLNLSPYNMSEQDFIAATESQNALALNWYKKDRSKLDILGLTSFLMDMGKIVLSNILEDEDRVEEFKEKASQTTTLLELEALEKEVFGVSNEEVTSIIFKEWNFDDTMCDAIKYLNNPQDPNNSAKDYSKALQVIKTITSSQDVELSIKIESATNLVKAHGLDLEAFNETLKLQFEDQLA